MRKRIILDIDEKLDHKLNTMVKSSGFDKGLIVEIALRRSIPDIENILKELIPVDVQDENIKSEVTQKNGFLVDQNEAFRLEIEDSLRKSMPIGVKASEFNISSSEPVTIELRLSNTDVENKHLTIPKKFLHQFPPKQNHSENHNEARDTLFKLVDGKYEYETHIEGKNRLPHITGIFYNHPELQPKDKVYIDIIEPKKHYRFRTE